MMGEKASRNTYSRNTNKIGIRHDALSYDLKILDWHVGLHTFDMTPRGWHIGAETCR